jgi:hypothetical protein
MLTDCFWRSFFESWAFRELLKARMGEVPNILAGVGNWGFQTRAFVGSASANLTLGTFLGGGAVQESVYAVRRPPSGFIDDYTSEVDADLAEEVDFNPVGEITCSVTDAAGREWRYAVHRYGRNNEGQLMPQSLFVGSPSGFDRINEHAVVMRVIDELNEADPAGRETVFEPGPEPVRDELLAWFRATYGEPYHSGVWGGRQMRYIVMFVRERVPEEEVLSRSKELLADAAAQVLYGKAAQHLVGQMAALPKLKKGDPLPPKSEGVPAQHGDLSEVL